MSMIPPANDGWNCWIEDFVVLLYTDGLFVTAAARRLPGVAGYEHKSAAGMK